MFDTLTKNVFYPKRCFLLMRRRLFRITGEDSYLHRHIFSVCVIALRIRCVRYVACVVWKLRLSLYRHESDCSRVSYSAGHIQQSPPSMRDIVASH